MKKSFLLLICLILSGCGTAGKDSRLSLMKTMDPAPVETNKADGPSGEEVKKEVATLPELYDVAVIKGKNDILVAYKVKHLKRFKMKSIEKKITGRLERKFPDANFTVSSDYKVFLEAARLREGMKSGKYGGEDAEQKLQEIIKLQQEKT